MKKDLSNFLKEHGEIYIYGCTEKHKIFRNYIESKGYRIKKFIVSDSQKIVDKDVIKLSNIIPISDYVGIIVSVSDRYYNEIIPNIFNNGFAVNDIYFLPIAERNEICLDFTKEKVFKKHDISKIKNAYVEYCNDIVSRCCEDFYYMYCAHFDLGDLVQVFQLKKRFEEKYKATLCYFITEKQKVVANICHVTDYIVIEKIKIDRGEIDENRMIELDIRLFETLFFNMPVKGNPFVIPFTISFRHQLNEINFASHFFRWLELQDIKVDSPELLKISDSLRKKLGNISLENIVLLAPEANSMHIPQMDFWKNIAKENENKGYTVITNSVDTRNHIPDTLDLNLSLTELIELAGNCAKVYSMRSGLCDCIAGRLDDFNIFYWSEGDIDYFGIKNNFNNHGANIHELVIDSMYY